MFSLSCWLWILRFGVFGAMGRPLVGVLQGLSLELMAGVAMFLDWLRIPKDALWLLFMGRRFLVKRENWF
jgi:hypothetical protein